MPYTTKFFFSFIFLCATFLNSSEAVEKCDSLFFGNQYFEASIEYERMIFEAKSLDDINFFKYRKALCYKHMGQFEQMLKELQPIYFSNPADSLYRFVCYELSLCYYLKGDPARTLWKIDEYFYRSKDSLALQDFLPLKILALNATYQWDEAMNSLLQFVDNQSFPDEKDAELKMLVLNIYEKKNRPHIKSVQKAEDLSRFLPGLGQVYAGAGGEGVINLLINASILAFAGFQVYNGFYLTGYLAGFGFFNKTYHGGIKRAGILADQKNKDLVIRFNSKTASLILPNIE